MPEVTWFLEAKLQDKRRLDPNMNLDRDRQILNLWRTQSKTFGDISRCEEMYYTSFTDIQLIFTKVCNGVSQISKTMNLRGRYE